MDDKGKYFIVLIILFANLLIGAYYNFYLRDIFFVSLLILVIFFRFVDVGHDKLLLFLSAALFGGCLLNIYEGLVNSNPFLLAYSLAVILLLIFPFEWALTRLTSFCLENNYLKASLKLVDYRIFLFGKNPEILSAKGAILSLLNQFEESLVCLNESEELGNTDPFLYNSFGCSWVNLEEYEKAYHYFKLAIDGNPNNIEYLINISYTLVNLDDYDGALYYFKKASEINEQDGRLKELKSLIEKNKATLKK